MKKVPMISKYIALLSSVLALGLGMATPQETPSPSDTSAAQTPARSEASKAVHVVSQQLGETADGFSYRVVGKVYNSGDKALANVVIVYQVWKKYYPNGFQLSGTKGQVMAHIKYLPPKQTIDFEATGTAPTFPSAEPGPLDDPEIKAAFAEE